MTLNATDFLLKSDGLGSLAKANKFSVMITPPTDLSSSVQADQVQFLCHTAELPGKQFSTVEDRIYGIEVMKPYAATYEPVSLTFYNTNNFSPRRFWEKWMDHIQPSKHRDMRYYNDMYGSIQIYHYPEIANETVPGEHNYVCTLNEAWPLSIGEIELNWENQDVAEFTVSIQYKDWSQTQRTTAMGTSSDMQDSTQGSQSWMNQYASYGRGKQR